MNGWFAFDAIIAIALLLCGAGMLELVGRRRKMARRWMAAAGLVILGTVWLCVFYGSFIEPRFLVKKTVDIALNSAPARTLRAALVSDIHFGPYKGKEWGERIVSSVNAANPDVIFLDGDFVAGSPVDAEAIVSLAGLKAPYGVFAVTGNHDYDQGAKPEVVRALQEIGVTVLENRQAVLNVDGKELVVAGISDIWNDASPAVALEGLVREQTVILLSHNPDVLLETSVRLPEVADLILSGHTHGGQIRLPWLGSVPEIPSRLGRAFDRGFFAANAEHPSIFITSGAGETGPRARFFVPPEWVLLTVRF